MTGLDIASVHAAGVQAVQDAFGDSCPLFTWAGQDWKVVPGAARRKRELQEGGFQLTSDLELVCLLSQFLSASNPTPSAVQLSLIHSQIVYLGQKYIVENAEIFPGAQMIRLACMEFNA